MDMWKQNLEKNYDDDMRHTFPMNDDKIKKALKYAPKYEKHFAAASKRFAGQVPPPELVKQLSTDLQKLFDIIGVEPTALRYANYEEAVRTYIKRPEKIRFDIELLEE